MKSLKNIRIILCIGALLASSHTDAQRFNIDVGAGYGFGLTSTCVTTGMDYSSDIDLKTSRFDYNTGFTGHLKLNYSLKNDLFLVAGGRYQKGSQTYDSYTYTSPVPFVSHQEDLVQFDYDQLDIQIGLGIEKQLSEKWSVYLSHGFTFFVYGNATTNLSRQHYDSNNNLGSLEETQTLHKPRFTFGAYGDLGLVYKVSKNLCIFMNTTVQSKNWSTKKSTITEYKIDGEVWSGAPPYATETVYENTINLDGNINLNEPAKELQTWMPNSGIEAVLGVRVGFGGTPDTITPTEVASRMYVQGTFGYGMPMSELTKVSNDTYFETVFPVYLSKSESQLYSYGKGLAGQLLLGANVGKGFSVEIGGVFNTSEYGTSTRGSVSNFELITSQSDASTKYSAWMVRNTYGLKLESQFKKVNAFIRTGLSLGFAGLKESTSTSLFVLTQDTDQIEREYIFKGDVSFGAYIGLGSSLRLSESFDLVAEAVTYIQNWSPHTRELTKHTVNGVDQLAGTDPYFITTEYLSEWEDSYSQIDYSSPRKELKYSEPFSSFMITLGIRYNFGRKK